MLRFHVQGMTWVALAGFVIGLGGCASLWSGGGSGCQTCSGGGGFFGGRKQSCGQCNDTCGRTSGGKKWWKRNNNSCDGTGQCDGSGKCKKCGICGGCCLHGCFCRRSLAIPDEYPLGAVMRAHLHQMQTNGEAADFILFQMDFVADSAELTPDGKDKILEMAARMRSAPFPVVIERTWNNADPELDAHRRNLVAMILTDLGNADANTRVFVSPAYGPGKHSMDAMIEFWQYTYQGYGGGIGGFGGGGLGGAGFGGGGFGGGFGGGGGGFF